MIRHAAQVLGWTASTLFIALFLAFTGLAVRVSQGPIDIDFLAPVVEKVANSELNGYAMTLGGFTFSDEGGRFGFRLRDLTILDPTGAELVRTPEATVDLSINALLRGVIAPKRLVFTGPVARVTRMETNAFRLGLGDASAEMDAAHMDDAQHSSAIAAGIGPMLGYLLDNTGAPPVLRALNVLEIHNANLVYDDRMAGRTWRTRGANFVISKETFGIFGSLDAEFGRTGASAAKLNIQVVRRKNSNRLRAHIAFDNVLPKDLASQLDVLGWLRVIDAPVSGDGIVVMNVDGEMKSFRAQLRAGAGYLRLDGAPPEHLRSVETHFGYDPKTDAFTIYEANLDVGPFTTLASGSVDLKRDDAGRIASAEGRVNLSRAGFSDPTMFSEPVALNDAQVEFTATPAPFALWIRSARARVGGAALSGAGSVRTYKDGWRTVINAGFKNLQAKEISRYWPIDAAPGAREWMVANILDGTATQGRISADLGAARDMFQMNFDFSDVVARVVPTMTPITGASGAGALTLDGLSLKLDAGGVELPGAGSIDLTGSSFDIPDFSTVEATADLKGAGSAKAILTLLDQPPLGFVGKLGLDPASVSGSAKVSATLQIPLLKNLKPEQVGVSATAEVANLTMTAPGLDLKVHSPHATLTASPERLRAKGPVTIKGIPANLTWTEVFSPKPGHPASTFDLAFKMTGEQIESLGAPPGVFGAGAMRGTATFTQNRGAPMAFRIKGDLTGMTLSNGILGWSKPIGAPSSLNLAGAFDDKGVRVSSLGLKAPDVVALGSAALSPNGDLRRVRLNRIALGSNTEIGLLLTPKPVGGYDIALFGPHLDLRHPPLLHVRAGSAENGGKVAGVGGDFSISVDIDRVLLGKDVWLGKAKGDLQINADGSRDARISGLVEGKAPANLLYQDGAGGRKLNISTKRAGDFLRATKVFRNAYGGNLRLEANFDQGENHDEIKGVLRIHDIVVKDAPTLAKILSIGSLVGLVDSLVTGGITFSSVNAPFRSEGDTWIVTDAAAYGPSMGLTLSGAYNTADDALDLDGSASPAYVINGVLNNIPIIGEVLTGGKGEGLFGVSYKVKGTVEDPQVTANPLSILAPGFLRKLFTRGDEAPPSNLDKKGPDR